MHTKRIVGPGACDTIDLIGRIRHEERQVDWRLHDAVPVHREVQQTIAVGERRRLQMNRYGGRRKAPAGIRSNRRENDLTQLFVVRQCDASSNTVCVLRRLRKWDAAQFQHSDHSLTTAIDGTGCAHDAELLVAGIHVRIVGGQIENAILKRAFQLNAVDACSARVVGRRARRK